MSLIYEGQSCPVCRAYLFEDDDVVYCPVCGAPHHRDCYNSIGHCALEQLHGTDRQYDREREAKIKAENAEKENINDPEVISKDTETGFVECEMCHERYDAFGNACPKCGTPNMSKLGSNFGHYDFLGGIPADFDIGEGVAAEEAKRFVASNTPRYVRKFAMMKTGSKVSWNWLAFLFPGAWFLARKMYKSGIITAILSIAASLLTIPFNTALYQNSAVDMVNNAEVLQEYASVISSLDPKIIFFAVIGTVAALALRVVCGIIGDSRYMNYTIRSIKKIKAESEDIDFDFRKRGGINVIAMMLGVMAVEYLPSFIAMLL